MRYWSSARPNSSSCAFAAVTFASPTLRKTIGPTRLASTAITEITTSISISVKPLVFRDTQDFLDRRNSRLCLDPPVLEQGAHPVPAREFPQLPRGVGLGDALLQFLRDDEQLEDSGSAAIARLSAGVTTTTAHQGYIAHRLLCQQRD